MRPERRGGGIVAVVLNWNGGDDTLACLESLAEAEVDAICVDNGSADGSADVVAARFPDVELLRNGTNLGYAPWGTGSSESSTAAYATTLSTTKTPPGRPLSHENKQAA